MLCLRLGTGVGDEHEHQAKGEPTENDDPTGEVEGLGGDGKDDQGDDDQTSGDSQADTELATGDLVGTGQVGLGEAHLEARKGNHGAGEDERQSGDLGQRNEHVLAHEGTNQGDGSEDNASKLGSAGLGINLSELLGQLALATHGEHDAARGSVEGVHGAHGAKRRDAEHDDVEDEVDVLEAGQRGHRRLDEGVPGQDGAERVDADHVEAAGSKQGEGDDLAELVPVKALGCLLCLLGNGIEASIEEGGQQQDGEDTAKDVVGTRRRDTAASTGDLGEDLAVGKGVRRGAGEDGDAHGQQHAAEQGLGKEGLELSSRGRAAEVQEDDVGGKSQGDDGGEQVNLGAQDLIELESAEPLEAGDGTEHIGQQGGDGDSLPRAQDAVAQSQEPTGDIGRNAAKGAVNVLDDAARDGDSSRKLAEHCSDGNQEDGSDEERDHCGNGAATDDHPVADLKHPTGADDRAEADGEEVPERQCFLHSALVCSHIRHITPPFVVLGRVPSSLAFGAAMWPPPLRGARRTSLPLPSCTLVRAC